MVVRGGGRDSCAGGMIGDCSHNSVCFGHVDMFRDGGRGGWLVLHFVRVVLFQTIDKVLLQLEAGAGNVALLQFVLELGDGKLVIVHVGR